jgi:hypothetical protein
MRFELQQITTLLCLLLGVSPFPARAQETDFEALRTRYARIRSIHLVAQAHPWVAFEEGRPTASGKIYFEYWADGDRYRLKCHSDRGLGLMGDMEIAFDGTDWQMLDVPGSTLHISKQESRQMPVACPNPLFMPLDFLSPDGDDCKACGTRLSDLADVTRWTSFNREARKMTKTAGHATYEITGQLSGGARKSYLVEFTRASGASVVSSLMRLHPGGRKDVELLVEDFRTPDPAVGPLPVRMTVKAFDEKGRMIMSGPWRIDTLEVNRPIEEGVFTIDWKGINLIWDIDARMFVKHPDDRVRNKGLSSGDDQ